MNQYVVLISRHFYDDVFTTQFTEYFRGNSICDARNSARCVYPMVYHIHPTEFRLVGYFTGEISLA